MSDTSRTYNIENGVHCADFIGRDQIIHRYGYSAEDVERLIERVLSFVRQGAVFQHLPDRQDALVSEHDGQRLVFSPGAASRLMEMHNERMYLLALILDLEYRFWASLFVPLAGKMDIRQVIEGVPDLLTERYFRDCQGGMQSQPTRLPLENIADAMQKHDAFVILGEPGSGKTTTLQKIAYDAARTILDGGFSRVPLFVRLSEQKERDPYTFLQAEWERRSGDSFENARRDGRILILADGVNEIPREKRSGCLKAWMIFAQDWRGGNQLIFSGREMDYDNQLSLPRVLVQPLDDERISGFLRRHQADDLQILLNDPQNRLREMASNPLHLFVLTMVYLRVSKKELHKLANRGWLFHEFSWY